MTGERPRYYDVATVLGDEIATGQLGPGTRLPVERSLSERFEVSRGTIRRAIQRLVDQGLVKATPRHGAFVARSPLSEPPNVLQSFTSMAAAKGYVPSAKLLRRVIRPAMIDEAESLTIAPGTPIFEVHRLRMIDGVPLSIEQNRLALARAPGIDKVDLRVASLYESLERTCGVSPAYATYALEAAAAESEFAEPLDLPLGSPLLIARGTLFDTSDRPISLDVSIYRSDRYRFRATLTRAGTTLRRTE